jgi:Na+-transporting NADH:ubiquinone oxidoreductase subunit B
MLHALVPIVLAAVYFFGWRAVVVLAVSNLAAFATEYAFVRPYREPVTSAVFVTGTLFALALPPTLPIWMAVIGVVFGVAFGKMVFGGFGRNVFNPALVGRAFIYVTFPNHMNASWAETVKGAAGGFSVYAADAVTTATPLRVMAEGEGASWVELMAGNVPGSYGETCAVLAVLGGIYIIWRKAANYRIVVSGLVGFGVLQTALWGAGVEAAGDPVRTALAGGFLFGLMFFATEPVSAPRTRPALWLYGVFIGSMTVLIRTYSAWPEGVMFAVLLGNTFAPITDYALKAWKSRKGS